MDIGIDLGTASVIIYVKGQGIVLREPSAVATDTAHQNILSVGAAAYEMLGKTPLKIDVVMPLKDGVICDYVMAEEMVRYFIKKITAGSMAKPRIAICVPSGITSVESNAVVSVAVSAGARKVYLIEEPVAAAIGAGLDISQSTGRMVVDIGGGTTDIAVLSVNGIVNKTSLRVAGNTINQEIIKYIKQRHNLLIGEKMAENLKIAVGNVYPKDPMLAMDVKGRDLFAGLPKKIAIYQEELCPIMLRHAQAICQALRSVLERTPPELVGDLSTNGIVMTGGGGMLCGLAQYIQAYSGIPTIVADEPKDCVAIGTGKAFDYLDILVDGFVNPSTRSYE